MLWVLLGVQQRDAGAVALAQQVDLVVAERPAGVLDVGQHLGHRVAADIDAVSYAPGRGRSGRVGDSRSGRRPQHVAVRVTKDAGLLRGSRA